MPSILYPDKPHNGRTLPHRRIVWPEGKQFAFTIFDDTDFQTAGSVDSVYAYLSDLGFRTTKSVWPVQGNDTPRIGGATCEDARYLSWVVGLQARGFEIGLHNVTYHTSTRQETADGLERFFRLFGHYPHTMANHTGCRESIYWGRARLSGFHRVIYDLLLLQRSRDQFEGHVEASPLFWGDLCREKIRYVRNFTFAQINTLHVCPLMPYYDSDRPFVNRWFAATEGPDIRRFATILREENQERLAAEGGACIMYTHFAQGFVENKRINQQFKTLMMRLSKMNGWFVPVHTLLDFLVTTRNGHAISTVERHQLERRWLLHKILKSRGRV